MNCGLRMETVCTHQKIHDGVKNGYYLFTWSIPVSFMTGLNVDSVPFYFPNKVHSYVKLSTSKDEIKCQLISTSLQLKCFTSLLIGTETLCFNSSKLLKNECGQSSCRCYELVTIRSEDESFLKIKNHPNNILVLICRIIYLENSSGLKSVNLSTNATTDTFSTLKKIVAALKNSPDSLLTENVVLKVGEETETVSKALLCSRSPVFAKMFKKATKEFQENEVIITDIKMPILRMLVTFLYTGKLTKCYSNFQWDCSFDFLCELYYASDKYDISDLRHLCVDLMMPFVSMENIIRVLTFAYSHNDIRLKSTAMALIAKNIETWIFTDDWRNLVNNELTIVDDILNFFDF